MKKLLKKFSRQQIGLVLGPLLFSIILFIPDLTGLPLAPRAVLAVTGWTATWWVTDAIPIYATSFLRLILLAMTCGIVHESVKLTYVYQIDFMSLDDVICDYDLELCV